MSERKVISKYYPPDFDPSLLTRTRTRGPKPTGPKVQTVRLMAPFSMKCTSCGEFIYKGRKFNARKETTEEKYYSIAIYRFYIRCTRCSGEITFKTDPKGMDYTCERGARRNFEVWRTKKGDEGGEGEGGEDGGEGGGEMEEERSAMGVLEAKTVDARREMAVADALDEIRVRNARHERVGAGGGEVVGVREGEEGDGEWERGEVEDGEAARRAFVAESGERVRRLGEVDGGGDGEGVGVGLGEERARELMPPPPPPPVFKRTVKKKKDFSAALGIKKKVGLV